jgi:hypothetical protein
MTKGSLRTPAPQSLLSILSTPALLAVASIAGIVIGLTGDDWRDALSCALLLLPIAVFLRHWHRRV